LERENLFQDPGLYKCGAREANFFKKSIFPQRVDASNQ
jgi:hypothetical protein